VHGVARPLWDYRQVRERDAAVAQPADGDRPSPRVAEGVFETMLVVDGEPLELDAHLRRLAASLRALYDAPLPEDLRARLLDGAREHALGRIRATVRPAEEGTLASEVRAVAIEPRILLPAWESAPTLRPYAVSAAIGAHKWADRALLERLEHDAQPAVPLLVDASGAVLEASRANVFVVREGVLATPPLDGRILPGVTRALVLELAAAAGVEAVEAPMRLDDLLAADEVFLTGAVRGIEPVRACGDATWPPGELTARLAAALERRWR
jgi:para-aminobenzoate synthetase/4-amino-4-deoxychorismate lyase